MAKRKEFATGGNAEAARVWSDNPVPLDPITRFLASSWEDFVRLGVAIQVERDRYKAALERIVEMAEHSDAHPDLQFGSIAREALGTDAPAPSASPEPMRPYCTCWCHDEGKPNCAECGWDGSKHGRPADESSDGVTATAHPANTFYEEDEPIEHIKPLAAKEPDGVTAPPLKAEDFQPTTNGPQTASTASLPTGDAGATPRWCCTGDWRGSAWAHDIGCPLAKKTPLRVDLNAPPADDVSADARVVYFEFEDFGTAEAFMEAVSDWLSEYVKAPTALEGQANCELRRNVMANRTECPRYWVYNDASASMGPASEFFGRTAPSGSR